MQMQIFVMWDEKINSIEVKPDFTVKMLKEKIKDKLGIETSDQTLLFKRGILRDNISLFQYDIQEGNVLTLFTYFPIKEKERELLQIFIKTITGKEITLTVDPSLTIQKLKCEIEDAEGVPSDQQRIIFAGAQLEDSRTLASYNIKTNATLNMIPRPKIGN